MKCKILFLILYIFLQSSSTFAYSEDFNVYTPFFKNIKALNFDFNTIQFSSSKKNTLRAKNLLLLNKLIANNGEITLSIPPIASSNNNFDNSVINLIKAYYNLLYDSKRTNSFKYFIESYKYAVETKYLPLVKLSLRSLLLFYSRSSLQNDNDYQKYLTLYKKTCSSPNDWIYYYSFDFNLLAQTTLYDEKKSEIASKAALIFKAYDSIFNQHPNSKLHSIYYFDKGNYVIRDSPSKAKSYYEKSLQYTNNNNYFRVNKFKVLLNYARVASLEKKFEAGIKYLYEASNYINVNDSLRYLYGQKAFLSDFQANLKNFDSAYYYAREVRFLGYKRKFQEHSTAISKIKVQIETIEKEKENLELKAKRRQDKIILTGITILIILISLIAFLNIKNSRKKHLLAEQQKEIEKQKNLTLLKEQEINTINAMVEGQEKERIRIAEDLHDNIGSVLATLKLHFENLKLNREKENFNQEELYDRTEKLIDETYLKVRSLAHAKNAGVIANKGLLVAIKLMAQKVSIANKLDIEVVDFGLDKKLDTNTEITIFRIIQELITNTIKHAEATKASINISVFDQTLNLILEDNGIGFEIENIEFNNTMGLGAIKKRINHLGGSIEIDTVPLRGTSIIINVPL